MLRLVKLGIISVAFFFLLLTAFGLFIPSRVRISRATNMAAAPDSVFALLDDRSRWPEWHPWFNDPAKVDGVGMQWVSKTDSSRHVRLSSPGIRALNNHWEVYRYAEADSITVQWYIDLHPRWYPWEKFGSLFYEGQYGPVLEGGLAAMKTRIHSRRP